MRKLCVIISIILILMLTSCAPLFMNDDPLNHPGTKWISEDETISFEVIEENLAVGTILIEDGTGIELIILHEYDILYVHNNDNDLIESWNVTKFQKNKFTVKVGNTNDRSIHEASEKITFYRVDDET